MGAVHSCIFVDAVRGPGGVGPTYHRPDITAPTLWHEAAAAQGRNLHRYVGGRVARRELVAWLRLYATGPTHRGGAAQQRHLAGALARVEEADAQVRIAGAPLFPNVDFGADATRERAEVEGSGPRVFNILNPQITASYELDF